MQLSFTNREALKVLKRITQKVSTSLVSNTVAYNVADKIYNRLPVKQKRIFKDKIGAFLKDAKIVVPKKYLPKGVARKVVKKGD